MKRHKGRVSQVPREQIKIGGEYAIVSQSEGRITVKQIETAVMTMKRALPSDTIIKSRIQGHIAVSKKPLEVRMGKGKGAISHKVARVRINTVLFEIERIREGEQYMAGLKIAGMKLPVRYTIIKRAQAETQEKKRKEEENTENHTRPGGQSKTVTRKDRDTAMDKEEELKETRRKDRQEKKGKRGGVNPIRINL